MTKLAKIHQPWVRWRAEPGAFSHGSMTPVRIVLHDTECHDAPAATEIEAVAASWMRTPLDQDRLGSHFIIDGDGNIGQCGEPDELLYHVGGLNTGSVGVEQIGYAAFTEADWLRRAEQLDKVAKLLAWLHQELGIPLHVASPQGQGEQMHGIMTHAMVSRFEAASDGHTDPGRGYPLGHVLATANGYVKAGGWPRAGAQPPSKPGAGGGGRPSGAPPSKPRIVVRTGPKLTIVGHTRGIRRYTANPHNWGVLRRANGTVHFDRPQEKK